MVLSTLTYGVGSRFGDKKAIELIKQAGFDAVDYSMFYDENGGFIVDRQDYKKYAEELRDYAHSLGIVFNQAHAPFPSYRHGDDEYNEKTFERITRAIEVAGILGIGIIVVHPIYLEHGKKEFNTEFYNKLLPYCKENNVKVALENMWGYDKRRKCMIPNVCSEPHEFADFVDSLDREWFVACLDLGHVGLVGEDIVKMIKILGHDRLRALHVHDNNFKGDLHILPYTGEMEWDKIIEALKDINYDGDFTFEADTFVSRFPLELLPSAYSLMHDTGRYLISRLEK